MTSQLSFFIAQQRQAELVSRAEQARLGRPAPPHADLLAETRGYPPLCAHGMSSLTDRGYDQALARLHRG